MNCSSDVAFSRSRMAMLCRKGRSSQQSISPSTRLSKGEWARCRHHYHFGRKMVCAGCTHMKGLPPKLPSALGHCAETFQTQTHASSWNGIGSQEDLMSRDQCITVNKADDIIGHASKYDVHRFNPHQPQGLLHRAFSVFLFNQDNKLLLQQRAAGKITFPNVWTNTCCSHQLFGQEQSEVDDHESIISGSAQGAKTAAVRKLKHELGIEPAQLPTKDFTFLTRLHYCSADTTTYGESAMWGEHEMDYILLAKGNVDLQPNPEEVQGTAYVTEAELRKMMSADTGLLWSPWFRIIAESFLSHWWKDVDRTLTSQDMREIQTIHHILK